MAISEAFTFIQRAFADRDFRKSLYKYDGVEALNEGIRGLGYNFTDAEWEDAYTNGLLKCQTVEEAGHWKELQEWWFLLHVT